MGNPALTYVVMLHRTTSWFLLSSFRASVYVYVINSNAQGISFEYIILALLSCLVRCYTIYHFLFTNSNSYYICSKTENTNPSLEKVLSKPESNVMAKRMKEYLNCILHELEACEKKIIYRINIKLVLHILIISQIGPKSNSERQFTLIC